MMVAFDIHFTWEDTADVIRLTGENVAEIRKKMWAYFNDRGMFGVSGSVWTEKITEDK